MTVIEGMIKEYEQRIAMLRHTLSKNIRLSIGINTEINAAVEEIDRLRQFIARAQGGECDSK